MRRVVTLIHYALMAAFVLIGAGQAVWTGIEMIADLF